MTNDQVVRARSDLELSTRLQEADSSSSRVVKQAAAGAAALAGRGIVARLLALVCGVLIARALSPTEFGVVTLGLTMTALGGQIAGGTFVATLIRQQREPDRPQIEVALGLQLMVSGVLVVVAWTLAALLGQSAVPYAVMMLAVPFTAARFLASALLERHMRYRDVAVVEASEVIFLYAVSIPLVLAGYGVFGFAVAVVGRAVAGALLSMALARVPLVSPRLSLRHSMEAMRVGLSYQGVQLAGVAREYVLGLTIGAVGGLHVLGLWGAAYRLVQVPYLLFESLWRVSFPAMARLRDAGGDPADVISRTAPMLSVVTACLLAPFVAISPDLLEFLLGPAWREAASAVVWAAVALAIAGPASVAASGFLMARGDTSVVLVAVVLGAWCWILVAAALMPVSGVAAVGLGWLASSFAQLTILHRRVRDLTGVGLVDPALPAGIAVLLGGMVGLEVAKWAHTNIESMILIASVALFVCVAVLMALAWSSISSLMITLATHVKRLR